VKYKEATHQEVLAVLRARKVRETFEAIVRVVQEFCASAGEGAVQVEADVSVSNEYDDESYFDAYTLERFEVFAANRQRLPLIDPSNGAEIELEELIERQLAGLESDLLDHFEVTNGLCVLNLLEVPDAPVTLWLELADTDVGSTGAA
jgi:hypothetical protein